MTPEGGEHGRLIVSNVIQHSAINQLFSEMQDAKHVEWQLANVTSPYFDHPVSVVAAKGIPYLHNANRLQNLSIYLPKTSETSNLIGTPPNSLPKFETHSCFPGFHVTGVTLDSPPSRSNPPSPTPSPPPTGQPQSSPSLQSTTPSLSSPLIPPLPTTPSKITIRIPPARPHTPNT
jgi:hypothetical protein